MKEYFLLSVFLLMPFSSKSFASDEIYFGCVTPLTGASAGAGMALKWGFDAAVGKVNREGGLLGKKIKGVCLDDEGNPDKAVQVTMQHIAQGSKIIFGAINSGNVIAFSKITQEKKVPLIINAASASHLTTQFKDAPTNYVFRFGMSDLYQGELIARYAKAFTKGDGKKIALFHDTEGFGLSGKKIMEEHFEKLGIKDFVTVSFPKDKATFLLELAKVKAAGVQVIVGYALPVHTTIIAKEADQLGLDVKILSNWALWNPGTLAGGKSVEKIIAVNSASPDSSPRAKEFAAFLIKEHFNGTYQPFNFVAAAQAYDATLIGVEAIKLTGNTASDAIVSGLYKLKTFTGLAFSFKSNLFSKDNHEALNIRHMHFASWKDGKVVKYEDKFTREILNEIQ